MRCGLRLGICSVATAMAAVALNAKYPGGLAGFGADLCSFPRLEAHLRDEAEKERELHEHSAAIPVSLHAKQQIVANLVAEFISLDEAARQLRDLSAASAPAVRKYSPYAFDQATDEFALRLQVIDYVKAQLSRDPEFAACVQARLTRELFRDGKIKPKNARPRPCAESI
jgi:hypothetical protein